MTLHATITTHLAHLHDTPGWDFATARDELFAAVLEDVAGCLFSQVSGGLRASEKGFDMRQCDGSKTAPAGASTPVVRGLTTHHSTKTRSEG